MVHFTVAYGKSQSEFIILSISIKSLHRPSICVIYSDTNVLENEFYTRSSRTFISFLFVTHVWVKTRYCPLGNFLSIVPHISGCSWPKRQIAIPAGLYLATISSLAAVLLSFSNQTSWSLYLNHGA